MLISSPLLAGDYEMLRPDLWRSFLMTARRYRHRTYTSWRRAPPRGSHRAIAIAPARVSSRPGPRASRGTPPCSAA